VSSFAPIFVALFAAHQVADHWVQTQRQADLKGGKGWSGRLACGRHVATYTATGLLFLLAMAAVTGVVLHPVPVAVGLAVSAVTHYIADRRTPLHWAAGRLGKDEYWLVHGGGLYALDQSWHIGWLFVAALIAAV
jgi:hypothetical protein